MRVINQDQEKVIATMTVASPPWDIPVAIEVTYPSGNTVRYSRGTDDDQ